MTDPGAIVAGDGPARSFPGDAYNAPVPDLNLMPVDVFRRIAADQLVVLVEQRVVHLVGSSARSTEHSGTDEAQHVAEITSHGRRWRSFSHL